MSWIKLRTNLADDPSVWLIAETLDLDPYAVIGRLYAMWAWFDGQATADHPWVAVTTAALDRRLGCPGWCDACCAAGWLIIEDGRVGIPNFDRHNGQSAKERALAASRSSRYRDGTGRFTAGHGPVTVASRSRHAPTVTQPSPASSVVTTDIRKSLQDKELSGHAPVTVPSRSDRDASVTQALLDRGERGERERRGEGQESPTPPILILSKNQIPNTQKTSFDGESDRPLRATALAEYTARIEAFKRQQGQKEQPAGSPRGVTEGSDDEQRSDGGDTGTGSGSGHGLSGRGARPPGVDRGRPAGGGGAGRGIHNGQRDPGDG